MKTALKTLTLVAIGVAIGRVLKVKKKSKSEMIITEKGLILKVS